MPPRPKPPSSPYKLSTARLKRAHRKHGDGMPLRQYAREHGGKAGLAWLARKRTA